MVFLNILLALGGLCLSVYIYRTKRENKPLVCPLHGDCDFVTRSEYDSVLGFPAEVLGIFYYTAMILLFLDTIVVPFGFYVLTVFFLVTLSALGFLMSLYFTWLQFGVIKKWCTLCVSSALICTVIFILSLYQFWPVVSPILGL